MGKNLAIIFAGGSGARMGSGLPKQFIEVNGKPIIIHTLDAFEDHPSIDEIYVACKEQYIPQLQKMIQRFMITKVKEIVPGGSTGMESIYHALKAAKVTNDDDSIVLIHDGVRPCITAELIDEDIRSVKETGSAVTCEPFYETPIISLDGKKVDDVPQRDQVYTVQAPQCFYLGEVLKAHEQIRQTNPSYEGVIDTCTMMKTLGKEVSLVIGPRGNIKITTPEDLYILRAMLEYKETEKIFGFDRTEVSSKLFKE